MMRTAHRLRPPRWHRIRAGALRVLGLAGLLSLAACASVPTLPCNTPTPLAGSDTNVFRWARTRPAAAATAVAGVPAAAVSSALDAFECPVNCPFQSVTGVTFVNTGSSTSYAPFRSAGDFFTKSWYTGFADYNWSAIALCTPAAVGNPAAGVPATAAPCPGASIIVSAQANARSDVGIRVNGSVACGPPPGTPAALVNVQVGYPDGVTRLVRTDAAGNFVDVRRDFDRGGTVTILVVGSDNVPAPAPPVTILGP